MPTTPANLQARAGLLGIALLVAACTTLPVAPAGHPAAKSSAAAAAPSSAHASPVAASGVSRLVPPAGGGRVLAGTISLDAAYAVRSGTARLARQAGTSVLAVGNAIVAQGGGNLVAQGGGNVVSNDGGSVVSNDGGSVVSNDGGSVISNDGGSIIAQGGGNLVAQGGGNLISQDGGSLAADDGTTFLAAGNGAAGAVATTTKGYALAADDMPAPGTALPAAGMVVSVVSLDHHAYLPIGLDAKGAPVYAAYSDERGRFKIFLPAGTSTNVVVVASPPDSNDHRLARNLLVPPDEDRQKQLNESLDEPYTAASRFLRHAVVGELTKFVYTDEGVSGCLSSHPTPSEVQLKALLGPFLQRLGQAATSENLPALPTAEVDRRVQRATDLLLAGIDMKQLLSQPGLLTDADKDLAPEKVADVVANIFQQIQKGADARLARDPNAYVCGKSPDLAPFCDALAVAEVKVPPLAPRGGADVAEYAFATLLSSGDNHLADSVRLLLPACGVADATHQFNRILAAGLGAEFTIIGPFADTDDPARSGALQDRFLQLLLNGHAPPPFQTPSPCAPRQAPAAFRAG